jgi:hypothetical protein
MITRLPAFDELIDYLIEKATPQEIIAFMPSAKAQLRATELLDKNNAGTLSADEQFELEQLRQYDAILTKLKLRAQIALKQS